MPIAPYLFLSPFLLMFVVFWAYPLFQSVNLAFHRTPGPDYKLFVGLSNFRFLLSDPDFHKAVVNTVTYALFAVGLIVPMSLGLAVLLNSRALRLRNTFRFAFFAPHLMGTVFAAVLFSLLFAPRFGLINKVLHAAVGLPMNTRWLGDADLVLPAILLLTIWLNVGFYMIYFLAALQAVDEHLYEAAMVDGAGVTRRFWHVTLPGIRPVLLFVVVIATIGSLRIFELPYLLLNNTSGPDQAGLFVVTYLYQKGFATGELGYASAIGWTLAIGVFVITLLQIRLSGAMREDG